MFCNLIWHYSKIKSLNHSYVLHTSLYQSSLSPAIIRLQQSIFQCPFLSILWTGACSTVPWCYTFKTHHTLLSLSSCRMTTCLKISLHGLLSLLNDHNSFISSTAFYFTADPHALGVVTSLNISPINLSFYWMLHTVAICLLGSWILLLRFTYAVFRCLHPETPHLILLTDHKNPLWFRSLIPQTQSLFQLVRIILKRGKKRQ